MTRNTNLVFPHSKFLGFVILRVVSREKEMKISPSLFPISEHSLMLILMVILECFTDVKFHC